MAKKFFFGKKIILQSGREIDLSCEEEKENVISVLALFNHLDALQDITKPISIRFLWEQKTDKSNHDPIISIECRGGAPREDRQISESEIPIEGLNGFKEALKMSDLTELFQLVTEIYQKVSNKE